MGKTLFTALRRVTALITAILATLAQPAAVFSQASPSIEIIHALTLTPGNGEFIHFDKAKRYFTFERVLPCSPEKEKNHDGPCLLFMHDTYSINPFGNSISMINSVERSYTELTPTEPYTEDKFADIITLLNSGDASDWKSLEEINIDEHFSINVSYKGKGWDTQTRLRFIDKLGHILLEEQFNLLSVHNPIHLINGQDSNEHALMLELRWCGASSCQGQARFYRIKLTS